MTFQVATLVATGRKILVGSTSGVVGIFDSETRHLLNSFSWHKDKVRTLLVMPKEMEPCICAEIPFPEKAGEEANDVITPPSTASSSETPSPLHGKTTRILTHLQPASSHRPKPQRGMSVFSYLDKRFRINNPEPGLLASVMDGEDTTSMSNVHEQTKAEKLRIFERAQLQRSHWQREQDHSCSKYGDDIVLLTWRS